jgi:hypothetical protein
MPWRALFRLARAYSDNFGRCRQAPAGPPSTLAIGVPLQICLESSLRPPRSLIPPPSSSFCQKSKSLSVFAPFSPRKGAILLRLGRTREQRNRTSLSAIIHMYEQHVKTLGEKICGPARVRSRDGRPKPSMRKDLRRRKFIQKYRLIFQKSSPAAGGRVARPRKTRRKYVPDKRLSIPGRP